MRYIFTKIVAIVVITFILTILTSCGSTTANKGGIVSGKVNLFSEKDHSGITVLIFSAEAVPSEIANIEKKYPSMMFDTNEGVWFDHRQEMALDTVVTDSEGEFRFNKLHYGKYILVYYKEDWGYNYLSDVVLEMDYLDLSKSKELMLYPEEEIPSFVNERYVLESNKCYVAKNDVIFSQQSHLIFCDNSRLLLGEYVKIDIYGDVDFPDDDERALVTSYAEIYDNQSKEVVFGEGINVYSKKNSWRNVSFSYLQNALSVSVDNLSINRLSFIRCYFGLLAKHCKNTEVKKCYFANNNFINTVACSAYAVEGFIFNDNIVFNNHIGVLSRITTNAEFENNAFINNEIGFSNKLESECVFKNNLLLSCATGLENSGGSDMDIFYNHIEADIAIKIYDDARIFNTPEKGITKANFNNILAQLYAVESLTAFITPIGPFPLDFRNNYWGTTDTSEIDDLIVDYQKIGLENVFGYMRTVIEYIPIRRSKIVDAGIQR
jgi:hypothetical protein